MAIGMTYEQYWYGDPLMVRAYYQADKIRQQRMNDEAWMHGAYVYRALLASIGNIVRKKGTQPYEYPQEPIQPEKKADEVTPYEAEKERQRLVARLNAVAAARKRQEKGGALNG